MFWYNPWVIGIGLAIFTVLLGIFNWKNIRRFGRWLRARIHRATAEPGETNQLIIQAPTLAEISTQTRIDLRSINPITVVVIGGVTHISVWLVISNFSLSTLKVTKLDVHLQFGQFVTKAAGIEIGKIIGAQGAEALLADIALNDSQTRSLHEYVPDNSLREPAIVNVYCYLESVAGEVKVEPIFHVSNQYIGLSPPPITTLKLVPSPFQNIYTSGSYLGEPCIHVTAHMSVTNISERTIQIIKARLEGFSGDAPVLVLRRSGTDDNQLQPGEIAEAQILFTVQPPPLKFGSEFVATLVAVDNLNNEHRNPEWRFSSKGDSLSSSQIE